MGTCRETLPKVTCQEKLMTIQASYNCARCFQPGFEMGMEEVAGI